MGKQCADTATAAKHTADSMLAESAARMSGALEKLSGLFERV